MLTRTMQDGLNAQIQKEFASAYAYLAMAAHCEEASLPGCARWLRLQAREEAGHAMKLFDFVHDRGGRVTLQAIEQPPAEFASVLEVFQQALEHERKVSAAIHQLYGTAARESDYASQALLQWFVTEQVEEEKQAAQIVEQLKLAGDSGAALLMLDRQLGARSEA